jgi:hypothetical protein
VLQFKGDLPAIVKALEEISEWKEDISYRKASMLKVFVPEFILTVLLA